MSPNTRNERKEKMLRTDLPEIITATLPGPKAQAVIDRRAEAVPSAIRCAYPLVIEKGEGAMIQDVDGNKFLDWIGGVGVLNAGFSQPEIIEAVKEQADKFFHCMFNVGTHEGYVSLAEKLAAIAPVKGGKKKVFFANSGAEADENAVKLAKAYTKRKNIIVFSGAFHGRTLLTMSMTSKKRMRRIWDHFLTASTGQNFRIITGILKGCRTPRRWIIILNQ